MGRRVVITGMVIIAQMHACHGNQKQDRANQLCLQTLDLHKILSFLTLINHQHSFHSPMLVKEAVEYVILRT